MRNCACKRYNPLQMSCNVSGTAIDLAALCPPWILCLRGGGEGGLRCALPAREDLLVFMAAEFDDPLPEPTGKFPIWSSEGLGPG